MDGESVGVEAPSTPADSAEPPTSALFGGVDVAGEPPEMALEHVDQRFDVLPDQRMVGGGMRRGEPGEEGAAVQVDDDRLAGDGSVDDPGPVDLTEGAGQRGTQVAEFPGPGGRPVGKGPMAVIGVAQLSAVAGALEPGDGDDPGEVKPGQ
jgi:hypothetical protein